MAPIAHGATILGAALSEYLLQHLLKAYGRGKWSDRDRLVFSNRVLGGCHSLVIGLLALREATQDHWKEDDLIHTKSSRGNEIVALELGFLLQGQPAPCRRAYRTLKLRQIRSSSCSTASLGPFRGEF